jgi:hypothetical protein
MSQQHQLLLHWKPLKFGPRRASPEGYRFTAKMGEMNERLPPVPPGGVQKGEIFSVPIHY